jgi:hypothetical protein
MSMILDVHEPSRLFSLLSRYDVPVATQDLESGDCIFSGYGPSGRVMIGIERKTLSDLINVMQTRRLSGVGGQIPRMWDSYDFCFLTVEGMWRPGPGGEIETFTGRRKSPWEALASRGADGRGRHGVSYRQLVSYLTMLKTWMAYETGNTATVVTYDRTATMEETAALWVALYHTFQKPWREHSTYQALYKAGPRAKGHGNEWALPHCHDEDFTAQRTPGGRVGSNGVENPTTAWRWAADLPGVETRAKRAADYFGGLGDTTVTVPGGSAARLAVGTEEEWMAALGIGKGRKTAKAVVRAAMEKGA